MMFYWPRKRDALVMIAAFALSVMTFIASGRIGHEWTKLLVTFGGFALINFAVFVAIRPDDLGKTLSFRAVSLETDPDLAEVQTITMTTIESLREWQPYNVQVRASDYDMLAGSSGYYVWPVRAGQ